MHTAKWAATQPLDMGLQISHRLCDQMPLCSGGDVGLARKMFIQQVHKGDWDVAAFLQRLCGRWR